MGRTSRIALIALVAATVLTGCGGDAPDVPEIEGVPQEQVEEVTEQVEAAANFCEAAESHIQAGAAFNEFARAGEAPRPAEEIQAVLEPLRASTTQMVESAPEEQRADLELIAAAQEASLSVYEATGGDATAALSDPTSVQKAQEAAEADARIRQYLLARCRLAA
ncbi:MAG TPA: hypothetical protein VM367_17320 [Pseudonocardia sp.]|nr:hypothetical protein [Pseudonocardia sp.]